MQIQADQETDSDPYKVISKYSGMSKTVVLRKKDDAEEYCVETKYGFMSEYEYINDNATALKYYNKKIKTAQ